MQGFCQVAGQFVETIFISVVGAQDVQGWDANAGKRAMQELFFAGDGVSQVRFAQVAANRAMTSLESNLAQRAQNLFDGVTGGTFQRDNQFLIQFDDGLRAKVGAGDAQQVVQGGALGASRQFDDFAVCPMTFAIFART